MKKTLGALIAQTRKEKGMTQLELAEKMGVTDKAVSKWERDLSCPDIQSLPLLAQVLDLSLEELMQGEEKSRPAPKEAGALVSTILRGVALAMGAATAVLSFLDALPPKDGLALLGLGLACLPPTPWGKGTDPGRLPFFPVDRPAVSAYPVGRNVYEPNQNQSVLFMDSAGRGGGGPGRVADPGGCQNLYRQHRAAAPVPAAPGVPGGLDHPVCPDGHRRSPGFPGPRRPPAERALAVFGLQLGMNFLWSILFFKFQRFGPGPGVADRPLGRHPLDGLRLFQGGQSSGPAADPLPGMGGLCRVPEPGSLGPELNPKTKPEQPDGAVPVVLLTLR